MKKGKRFKPKVSKYVLKVQDMDITILCNHIKERIFDIKDSITKCDNSVDIEYLLLEKYALMRINKQLGFSHFNDELAACNNVKAEAEKILKENIKNHNDLILPTTSMPAVDKPPSTAAAATESEMMPL